MGGARSADIDSRAWNAFACARRQFRIGTSALSRRQALPRPQREGAPWPTQYNLKNQALTWDFGK